MVEEGAVSIPTFLMSIFPLSLHFPFEQSCFMRVQSPLRSGPETPLRLTETEGSSPSLDVMAKLERKAPPPVGPNLTTIEQFSLYASVSPFVQSPPALLK